MPKRKKKTEDGPYVDARCSQCEMLYRVGRDFYGVQFPREKVRIFCFLCMQDWDPKVHGATVKKVKPPSGPIYVLRGVVA